MCHTCCSSFISTLVLAANVLAAAVPAVILDVAPHKEEGIVLCNPDDTKDPHRQLSQRTAYVKSLNEQGGSNLS